MDSFFPFALGCNLGSPGKNYCLGLIWKKLWIVFPLAFMAATPVGATTAMFFVVFNFLKVCKKVVFPVPALPVRKRDLWVYRAISSACINGSLDMSNPLDSNSCLKNVFKKFIGP